MVKKSLDRIKALFSTPEYTSRQSELQEIADFCMPGYQNFSTQITPVHTQRRDIDNSPAMYLKELTTTIINGMVSPGTQWMRLTAEEVEAVQLDEISKISLHQFVKSGGSFNSQIFSTIESCIAFGLGVLGMDWTSKDGTIYKSIPISQVAISENYEGEVDTVVRKFKMTARNISERWEDYSNSRFTQLLDKFPEKELYVYHYMYKKDGKYHYEYILEEMQDLLQYNTENYPMFVVFRWARHSGEIYGHGQGKLALGFMRSTTLARKYAGHGLKWTNLPLFVASEDLKDFSNFKHGQESPIRPGAIIVGALEDGQRKVEPLQITGNVQAGIEFYNIENESLKKAFFMDKIQLPKDNTRRTAFEIAAMQREEIKYLAPFISNLEASFKKVVEVVLKMLHERGKFKNFEIEVKDLSVELLSPLARQLKMEDARAIMSFLQMVSGAIPISPESVAAIDVDKIIRIIAESTGTPASILRTEEAVQQIQQTQQQQQQLAMQQQQADVGKTASETIKNIGGGINGQ